MTVAHSASTQKRTGVYEEKPWNEREFGCYHTSVDGVEHVYELDPSVPSRHIHYRDGVQQSYGRHVHDRWNEPHRHLHPGDRAPSEARQNVGAPRELPQKERHSSHRTYVTEAATIGEAIDALAMAVRLGSAAYEDGRWRDGYQQFVAAKEASEAAMRAAGLLIAALEDLWHDGGANDRPVVEFAYQAKNKLPVELRAA